MRFVLWVPRTEKGTEMRADRLVLGYRLDLRPKVECKNHTLGDKTVNPLPFLAPPSLVRPHETVDEERNPREVLFRF